ncbi:TonB-dependent receptor plug domain-containing protein [Aliiglaciecola lipolytica]|uniref:Iron complex outermembrane recepter protein n=1 Tax=Aliiglaciecola lipolytica E3 TaxID=1127673 RepID=K6YB59_9ALTE|nr:TonB-dependent receptor [Aliiglaciecola lipolytica]GAC15417.1 iron complex outermembrane recepter protein [Aliiglaciecola lipolytica E3]
MQNKTTLLALSVSLAMLSPSVYAQNDTSNEQSDPLNIEKMTVVSSRISLPTNRLTTSVSVLDESDLALHVGLSVAELLRQTPSVGVSNSGGLGKNTVVRIRGEEGFRTKLYIDNVELTDASSPQVAPIFDDVLIEQLSRIEILRGTQGLSYGADAGGVISMYSKQAATGFDASGTLSIGSFDTQGLNANITAGNDTGNVFLSASKIESDGFNAQSSDESGEKDGYENQTVHFKGQLALTNKIDASLVFRNVDAENQYDGCYDNVTFALINQCTTEAEQQTIRGALKYQGKNSQHQIAVNKTDVERDFFNNGEFGFSNSGSTDKIEYLGSINWQQHDLVFGAEKETQKIDESDLKRDQKSVFAEWLGQFDNQIALNLGFRIDDNDTFGKHNSVRVGAAKVVTLDVADVKFKTSYGTGFRAPSLYEQSYNDGPFAYGEASGLQLNEENSEGLDIGFELNNRQGLNAEVVFFKQTIENEIVFDLVGFQGYLQTAGESESKGVEANIEQVYSSGFTIWANYTYNQTEDNAGEVRLRRPKNKFNFGLRQSWLNDTLNAELTYRNVRNAVDIAGTELDDYQVTHLSAHWQLAEYISFKAGVNNLFNENYQEVSGFNTAGRNFFVSTTLRL